MNGITLQLKPLPAPVREPVAWFIAGGDVHLWIEEICRWNVPQENLRLFVLSRSAADRSAVGVLVIVPPGGLPACVPRALGFGVVSGRLNSPVDGQLSALPAEAGIPSGGRLYLPVDGQLWPPVEPLELKLVYEVQVFHPGIGLVGFESKDALKLADLLRQPPSRVENWNFARSGVQLNQRLLSVQVLAPISLEEIFGEASKEIGCDPIEQLPPAPNELWSRPAGKWWSDANRRLAQALNSLLRRLPHTGSHRTWVNDLEDWTAARFQRLAQDLETMRNKELHRLLHQLEDDPEEGLRHALPLTQLPHRGQAPPAGRLGTRPTDFNLDQLRGGRPADFWHLPAKLRLQLQGKYRELANRELQLGRFRRAAYIFAHLLGDLESAASALKQGRHFREAAAVYKEHLHRPREAAVCLSEGGLFAEAIAIYEEQSCFLEAGDLYTQLGQPDQAKAAYELEVQKRLTAGDRLGGAQLLEKKLVAPEQALTMLREGWPQSPQAGKCLAAGFELLARHHWHPQAAALLEELRVENTRPDLISSLAQILTTQSAQYPDRPVRHAASDLMRVKASQRLDGAASAEISLLSSALMKLAPEDKLLARDASRFSALRNEQLRNRKRPVTVRKTNSPILVRTFDLPKGIAWHTVKSCGGYFFAAGYGSHTLYLVRGDWEGAFQIVTWPSPWLSSAPLLLELDEETSRPDQILITPGPSRPLIRLPELAFPAADRFVGVLPAGTPGWLAEDLVAACTRAGVAWILRDVEGGLCECRLLDGRLVSTLGLAGAFEKAPGEILYSSLLIQRDYLWLAARQHLFLMRQGKTFWGWQAETEIVSLVPSAPNLPLCAVARLQRGVSIHWIDNLKETTETLCAELFKPLAAFTSDGTLVLLGGNEGRICDVNQRGLNQISDFTWPKSRPIAVLRAEGPNQFAIFSDDGKAHVFRVPG